jgi:hypothetical protein
MQGIFPTKQLNSLRIMMANQFLENQKKASSLKTTEEKLNADLLKLQDELRFISDAVNKKVQERESVRYQREVLQEDTSKMVISGKWVEKEEAPVVVEEEVATSAAIVQTPTGNSLWNFVKRTFSSVWNFFSEKLRAMRQ